MATTRSSSGTAEPNRPRFGGASYYLEFVMTDTRTDQRLADAAPELLAIVKLYLSAPAGRSGALIRAEAHRWAHRLIDKIEER